MHADFLTWPSQRARWDAVHGFELYIGLSDRIGLVNHLGSFIWIGVLFYIVMFNIGSRSVLSRRRIAVRIGLPYLGYLEISNEDMMMLLRQQTGHGSSEVIGCGITIARELQA